MTPGREVKILGGVDALFSGAGSKIGMSSSMIERELTVAAASLYCVLYSKREIRRGNNVRKEDLDKWNKTSYLRTWKVEERLNAKSEVLSPLQESSGKFVRLKGTSTVRLLGAVEGNGGEGTRNKDRPTSVR